jgi:hypothetical protein
LPVVKQYYYGQPYAIINFDIEEVAGEYEYESLELPKFAWNRATIISAIVRCHYTQDDVEAIINNHIGEPEKEEYTEDFNRLQAWRRHSKDVAHDLIEWAADHGIYEES